MAADVRKKPKQARSRKTVESILEATILLIQEEGFDNISTNRIAKRAGVSIGSLYQYFPDKESILNSLIDQLTARFSSHLSESIGGMLDLPPSDIARSLLSASLAFYHTQEEFISALLSVYVNSASLPGSRHLEDRLVDVARQYFLHNSDSLDVEKPGVTAYVMVNSILMLLWHYLLTKPLYIKEEELLEEICQLIDRRLSRQA